MFPFLVGAFVGKSFAEIVFSRPVMLMLVWLILPRIASEVAYHLVPSKQAGLAAALATMAAMAAFASMPRPSAARLALLEGMLLWAALILLIAIVRVVIAMIALGPVAGAARELRWLGYGVGALALAGLAQWRIDRTEDGTDLE